MPSAPQAEMVKLASDAKVIEVKEAPADAGAGDEDAVPQPLYFYAGWILAFIVALYFFLFGLDVMGNSFKALSGKGAGELMSSVSNPVAGLMVGIIVTVLLQSSSTTTSIVTSMVGASILSVDHAIPVIMGANIGTSVTNTLIAHGQINDKVQFRQAFAGATVHDMFNMLSVVVLLPIEIITGAMGFPLLYELTYWLTEPLSSLDEATTFESPIAAIVKPLSKAFIAVNKDNIKMISLGCMSCDPTPFLSFNDTSSFMPGPLDVNGTKWCKGIKIKHDPSKDKLWPDVFLNKFWKAGNYMDAGGDVCYESPEGDYSDCSLTPCYDNAKWTVKYVDGDMVKDGFLLDWFGSAAAAVISLVISLVTLCAALYVIVYALQKVVMANGGKGKMMARVGTVLNYNYLAMLLGMLMTICVQSSSIITSTLTPLVGMGAITLEQMLPLTLGANIGTTCTALLASLVAMKREAIQIALCHLFFNIAGILVWFPIPYMRSFPIAAARQLGCIVVEHPWFGMFYVFYAFVTVPLLLYGVSTLFEYGAAGILFGTIFTLTILAGAFASIYKFELVLKFVKERMADLIKRDAKYAEVIQEGEMESEMSGRVVPLSDCTPSAAADPAPVLAGAFPEGPVSQAPAPAAPAVDASASEP